MPPKKPVKKTTKKQTRGLSPSAKLFAAPEDMRAWSTMLLAEAERWPNTSLRRMFGMCSLYRGETIFAALPQTKAFFSPRSIIFKFESPTSAVRARMGKDARIQQTGGIGAKWFGFEMSSERDIRAALLWLDLAYSAATPAPHAAKKAKNGKKRRSAG